MVVYFFDSSAAVKRYLSETGTDWITNIADPAKGDRIYIASITGVEVVSAIARKLLNGGISPTEAALAITQFRQDFDNEYVLVELVKEIIDRAMKLAEVHALRGYDAVQLAAALKINADRLSLGMPAVTLISADAALNTAALAEGLAVEDPNAHP
ncbi:MAG: type II toxin-antitoxin system VapC family toxin [Blastocatellia bacterium]|nr:type II toxin-antitoxin system VapC family toxin [Blastocatellia bacterium]